MQSTRLLCRVMKCQVIAAITLSIVSVNLFASPAYSNTTAKNAIQSAVTSVSASAVNKTGTPVSEKDLLEIVRRGEAFIIMRHALAPGTGDPGHFKVDDCRTQRNLNDQGRQQSRAIGELLKKHGINKAAVMSSQWCRCLETANLLGIGKVAAFPVLNSFYQDRSTAASQTDDLLQYLNSNRGTASPTVLVTHQVNISALTNQFARSGEMLVVEINNLQLNVVGSILKP